MKNTSSNCTYNNFYCLGFSGDNNQNNCYSATLQQFINRIKAKFDEPAYRALNVELIDLTECNAINRHNIDTNTIDGLHPTADAHKELGKEIARILALATPRERRTMNISSFTNDNNYLTLSTLPTYNGGVS